MSDSLESLRRRKESAAELGSVVRTMKAMAASNIHQYEMAVISLRDYFNTISLGIHACLLQQRLFGEQINYANPDKNNRILAVVFGSDQGLVGGFNDSLANFVGQSLKNDNGQKEIWVVGERMQTKLADADLMPTKSFPVPGSVTSITALVNELLIKSEEKKKGGLLVFHNAPLSVADYEPKLQRLLPLDQQWEQEFTTVAWTSKNIPQAIGKKETVLASLVREYLFVSFYRACAESLASENASRLDAMQRAEKNIDEMLDNITHQYNYLRQDKIDEELFDVVSGFEALKKSGRH